jgi:hypothetical protein
LALVEQKLQSTRGAQTEMVIALGADLPIGFEILLPYDRPAPVALCPKAFGADTSLINRRRIFDRAFFSLKPGHGEIPTAVRF